MHIAKLLTDLQSKEPICIGPFCNQISAIPTGAAGNEAIAGIFGSIIGKVINVFVIFAGLAMLLYLLWGSLDWITSNGEKEKMEKARNKITHAIIGLVIVIVSLTIYGFIAGDLLGIVVRNADNTWNWNLPSLTR